MLKSTRRLLPASILRVAGLSLSCGFVALMPLSAAAQPGVELAARAPAIDPLPVRKITLYRSGVGFFERRGDITGDATLQLRFKTDQINDIIKSMVLLDRNGGRIDSVSYGSKEPIGRRLASFGVNISDNPSIPDLLNRLRGAPIKVTAGGEQITGTILGVEERVVQPPVNQPSYDASFVNLLTTTGMRSIAIADISTFEILDKDLADEMNKALAALAEYRADRSKTVDLRLSGKGVSGARDIVVGYVHEMPVWKTSYRLILPDEKATPRAKDPNEEPPGDGVSGARGALARAPGGTVALQGWAIVENNTDQDWNDVRLALVSGRPVSFQMDLYEPLFVSRPFIPVPTIPGVSPRAYSGGMTDDLAALLGQSQGGGGGGQSPFDGDGVEGKRESVPQINLKRLLAESAQFDRNGDGDDAARKEAYLGIQLSDMSDYAAAARAAAGEVGEVFQYELEAPVSLERQRSAMIPILTASISGRRVSIFNISDGSEHPMRGVEITNDSNLQLIPGPITVFDGSGGAGGQTAYAGDAQIGHIPPGDTRLLAYAVDLDVDVQTTVVNTIEVMKIRIVNGAYEQTVKDVTRQTYAFQNKDAARARTIVIEHLKGDGSWTLVNPKEAHDQTQTHYRFHVDADAGKTVALPVVAERVVHQSVGIMNYDLATVLQFQKSGKLSQAVVDAFRNVASKQADIHAAERSIGEIDRQLGEISKDQSRIRENMNQIDRNSQLYTRYITKLNEQESNLEELTQRRMKEQERLEKLRQDLDSFLRSLNVE